MWVDVGSKEAGESDCDAVGATEESVVKIDGGTNLKRDETINFNIGTK